MDRPKLNLEKIEKKLPTANDYLNQKYGVNGSPQRNEFDKEMLSFYYGELIKETRKEKKLTQQALADMVGKERSFIAKIEQGKTDLQISSLTQLIRALGLSMQII